MQNRNKTRFRIAVLIIALLTGVGGGFVGGYIAYSTGVFSPAPSKAPPDTSTPHPSPESTPVNISTLDYTTTITGVVQESSPAVVTVVGMIPGDVTVFGRSPDQQVSGSGVIISRDGYVITNNHVVEDAREVSIILAGGAQLPAEIIGTDKFADLAVLKVEEGQVPAAATFGNSENLSPGETVIAIGSPLGKFKNTVTVGVVSAMDRSLRVSENYQLEGLIQTDASINQGNSGGPLINLAGEVIGINTLIVRGGTAAAAEGLGFAIPSNRANLIARQIIDQGYFARPYLGIDWEWITPGLADAYHLPVEWGAYVSEVGPNSPAAEAGLRQGDIIIRFGDRNLNNNNPFINALYDHTPGETVPLTVKRNGETLQLEVTMSERPNVP